MQTKPSTLHVSLAHPPRALAAGLCLSRGTQPHPDRRIAEYELFFVRKGRLPIAESQQLLETQAGESLILWPQRRHYGTGIIPKGCEFYWLHFQLPPTPASAPGLIVPQRARPGRPQRLMELLHQFLHDSKEGRLTPTGGSLLVMQMLSEIAEQQPGSAGDVSATLADRADAAIARNFHLAISTSSIAREIGCNPDYLGRQYRRVFGHSIMTAISQRRIIEARRLIMEDPGSPFDQVAKRCGCQNQAWFRRIFKRLSGTTPDHFRRTHSGGYINS